MEKYDGPERREFDRVGANFVVSYRVRSIPNNYDLTQTKNVSQGGILLTTNRQFDVGILLAMTIRFPLIPQKIEVTGQVVDSREIVKELIYETRIKFLDLDTEFFQKLGKFVADHFKND